MILSTPDLSFKKQPFVRPSTEAAKNVCCTNGYVDPQTKRGEKKRKTKTELYESLLTRWHQQIKERREIRGEKEEVLVHTTSAELTEKFYFS